jgi:type II secretory pathway component PulJ
MGDSDVDDDGMNEISQLLNDYTSLQAAHQSLTNRCEAQASEIYAEVQQEMDSLRVKITDLEAQLAKSNSEKEELQSNVRDLRVRLEESRRALMRLQGPGGTGSAGDRNSGSVNAGGTSAGSNPNRRSMLPGSLTSWNPREVTSGSASSSSDQTYSHHTAEEAAELQKSKRASLAFGPNASTIARRAQGHRRIASGSKIGQSDDDASPSMMPPPINSSQGLRELHLGSGPSPLPTGTSSKRSSFLGSILSPSSEIGQEDAAERVSSNSLLMPSKLVRKTSTSSSRSGSTRDDSDTGQPIPSNGSRSNLSTGPSTIASPILETEEGGDSYRDGEELWTARGPLATSLTTGVGSHFGALQEQHQQQLEHQRLQRLVAEQNMRLQGRDARLEEMQREMQALRSDLEEAKEARIASESCLKALRDFVKDEGGRSSDTDGGAQVLKGVKLPPLPTDRDTDDLSSDSPYPSTPGSRLASVDVNTPTQATSNSSWRSFSNTFAGLSRAKSNTQVSEESAAKSNTSEDSSSNINNTNKPLPSISTAAAAVASPLSPAVNISASIGSLFNRSAPGRRQDSVSVSSTGPSDSTVATSNESRHTSMTSSPGDGPVTSAAPVAPPTAYKGFNWFSKRTTSDGSLEETAAAPSPSSSPRVSSPPFASLDHHVLTLDQVNSSKQPRTPSMASIGGAGDAREDTAAPLVPNDRVRRTMQKSSGVEGEENGFAPPNF